MRPDGGRGVPEARRRRVPDVLAPLPGHRVRAPDHEVVARLLRRLVLLASARGLGPAPEQNDVRARNVHGVVKSVLRWGARHTETRPYEGLGVQHTDVVQVALLEGRAHSVQVLLHLLIVEVETAVYHQVGTNKDRTMTLPRAGGWSSAGWLGPCHDFKVENEDVVEEVGAVPATEHEHLGAAHQVRCVVESGSGCTTTLWALIPGHGDRVQGV